jgi:hypothetical protein
MIAPDVFGSRIAVSLEPSQRAVTGKAEESAHGSAGVVMIDRHFSASKVTQADSAPIVLRLKQSLQCFCGQAIPAAARSLALGLVAIFGLLGSDGSALCQRFSRHLAILRIGLKSSLGGFADLGLVGFSELPRSIRIARSSEVRHSGSFRVGQVLESHHRNFTKDDCP